MASTMGRPSQLSDPIREAILTHIRNGNYAKDACAACGIQYTTYKGWVNQGNKDIAVKKNTAFASFVIQIKEAEAQSLTGLIQTIRNASERQWQAAAWLAERRHPEKWADNRAEMRRLTRTLEDALRALEEAKRQIMQPPPTPPPTA